MYFTHSILFRIFFISFWIFLHILIYFQEAMVISYLTICAGSPIKSEHVFFIILFLEHLDWKKRFPEKKNFQHFQKKLWAFGIFFGKISSTFFFAPILKKFSFDGFQMIKGSKYEKKNPILFLARGAPLPSLFFVTQANWFSGITG